ncbi:MAG: redoxin family protein [Phycisphaerae bacterium]|nr:redoxin family protein [Phycisphaerae bacterium]
MTSGKQWMVFVSCVTVLLAAGLAEAQTAATKPAEKSTTQPADAAAIPEKTIRDMTQPLRERPKGDTEEELQKNTIAALEKSLAMGRDIVKTYPDAPNLAAVYQPMLEASQELLTMREDDDTRRQFNDLIEHVLKSSDDSMTKLMAEFVRLEFIMRKNDIKLAAMLPDMTEEKLADPTKLAAELIEAFVDRNKDTLHADQVYMGGAMLASSAKQGDLQVRYVKVLKENYASDRNVKGFLKSMFGEDIPSDHVGKPFEATLTTLDGKKLTLPDDFKGKVVVIDFWATWCGPCVAAMPKLKKFHDAYKDKDVVLIAISMDDTKEAAEKFLKDKDYGWIWTWDAGGWETPVAERYDIIGIPTLFVVDKEGVLVSDNARANLEIVVDRALQGNTATTKPAKE